MAMPLCFNEAKICKTKKVGVVKFKWVTSMNEAISGPEIIRIRTDIRKPINTLKFWACDSPPDKMLITINVVITWKLYQVKSSYSNFEIFMNKNNFNQH